MANSLFDVSIFFILFRETVEASIIISVLLAFLKQGVGNSEDTVLYKRLVRQVWVGSAAGFAICLFLGSGCILAWYLLGEDVWAASEDIWEGVFCLIAGIIISLMGQAMLRLSKMKDKWRVKIAKALAKHEGKQTVGSFSSRYAMAILPFVTVLRESIEAVVFMGGVSLSAPPSAFPLSVIAGIGCGTSVGYFIYSGGNHMRIQIFLIISTCFLYLVAAGLMSRSVWYFENYHWSQLVGGDVAEVGSGPGSYDIRQSVWHVNCCNPLRDGGWMIFQAFLGWQNSATYGSVFMYNLYWICVMVGMVLLKFREDHGYLPLLKKYQKPSTDIDLANIGCRSSVDDHSVSSPLLSGSDSRDSNLSGSIDEDALLLPDSDENPFGLGSSSPQASQQAQPVENV
ncbi:iron permease FTR1 family-domain-containing protein [Lipomyces arxii]|uniref:iron permease FTR1 family-domain-containing protein n=1 Tax=Lipomyces arxii TaxID=56418 RepID=UPI0034D01612